MAAAARAWAFCCDRVAAAAASVTRSESPGQLNISPGPRACWVAGLRPALQRGHRPGIAYNEGIVVYPACSESLARRSSELYPGSGTRAALSRRVRPRRHATRPKSRWAQWPRVARVDIQAQCHRRFRSLPPRQWLGSGGCQCSNKAWPPVCF